MRSTADIRRANAFDVVRALHGTADASRREIAQATGLSNATITNICNLLLTAGVVTESRREKAATGRPTTRLTLNPTHGRFLGVDIAETYVHVETLNLALDCLSSTDLEIDYHRRRPRQIVERVTEAIQREAEANPSLPLLGVGVSAPGQVDQVGGTSVFAPNWGWRNVPLLDLLTKALDAPMRLDNPLKSLVLAQLWTQPLRATQDFVVVNLGTGVGLGAAIDGHVLRGRTNSAGEWGHTVIVADGRQCRCGSRGCIEAYVGAAGIMQTLREVAPNSPVLHADDQTLTMRALAQALERGDPAALATAERTAHFLGIGLASVINMLNPEVVVLAGWVTQLLGERLLDMARPHIARHALAVSMMAASFEIEHPRNNSVSVGAAATALEAYLEAVMATDESASAKDPSNTPAPSNALSG